MATVGGLAVAPWEPVLTISALFAAFLPFEVIPVHAFEALNVITQTASDVPVLPVLAIEADIEIGPLFAGPLLS